MKDLNPEMGKFATTKGPPQDNRGMVDIATLPNFPANRSGTPREEMYLAPNKMETPRILNMNMVPDICKKRTSRQIFLLLPYLPSHLLSTLLMMSRFLWELLNRIAQRILNMQFNGNGNKW
ncbi:ALH_1c_G0040890.mRNA.1.CDS.1 [Saccharomyces cerevisiae]|nr:ALH_1c_G0040890.mRNA.1.CDS.1 [Saccharomyces cerevisiae]CAI6836118.1 ALH_1c_G0040890.mRNA.1.CDS.1 [Saccharomyces cerevisiae]